jgi:hypothetical protein
LVTYRTRSRPTRCHVSHAVRSSTRSRLARGHDPLLPSPARGHVPHAVTSRTRSRPPHGHVPHTVTSRTRSHPPHSRVAHAITSHARSRPAHGHVPHAVASPPRSRPARDRVTSSTRQKTLTPRSTRPAGDTRPSHREATRYTGVGKRPDTRVKGNDRYTGAGKRLPPRALRLHPPRGPYTPGRDRARDVTARGT